MIRRLRIDDLVDIAIPEQPALSPDGQRIAYVLRTIDRVADSSVRRLWCVDAVTGRPQQITGGRADSAPSWSPDGTWLAFVRTVDGVPQMWLLPIAGGEPEQLTTLPLGAGEPVWSPDGTQIAFSSAVDSVAGTAEDEEAKARRVSEPIVADRLGYRVDGAGLRGTVRRHLHVVDLATRLCRQVTEGDWDAGRPAWSPDGSRLAFVAAAEPDADLTLRTGAYVLQLAGGGAAPRLVGLAEGIASAVTWSADGDDLLVVGTPSTRRGISGLLRVSIEGDEVENLAAPLDRNVMPGGSAYPGALPQLADAGRTVLFCARDRGCTHVYAVPVEGGRSREEGGRAGGPRLLLGGAGRVVSGMSVVDDTAALVMSTASSFGEIVVLDLRTGVERVRTAHGANLDDVELFARSEREFVISDGTTVHGWMIRDPQVSGPQPLLLDIHGGPHNSWNGSADGNHVYHQELAARGWTVLLLNPRASDGYGEDFYRAGLGAWGEADAKDFLEPLDELVAEGVADPQRLAVVGYSYGGFMTCYLTSRDSRFAAAVAGGPISDLASMVVTSDLGNFLAASEMGGQPWEGGTRYETMSPFSRVNQVTTPTLILHGLADARCPVGQAQQWHSALRARRIPTRLVLYPGASHGFIFQGRPSHRLDYNHRIVDWVERYAGDSAGARPPRLDRAHWQRRLDALAERHRTPGAALGILRLSLDGTDDLITAASGVLSRGTGVPVTADSLFQIGSISKVWTATLIMQLVDEGLLDLDAPILDVLPELRLADPQVTEEVTMRHLLTHTSGIDGDVLIDTGRGEDCVQRYVALLRDVPQGFPLGASWSYSNSGFVIIGRVVEVLTGLTWDDALRERIYGPLGLHHTVTLPEEVALHRFAVGHAFDGDGEPAPVKVWQLPRGVGPSGQIISSVADVLAFARLHLTEGRAPDGTRILSATSASAMTDKHADLPDQHTIGDSWGLGWARFDWGGHRLIGHDGSTIGQESFLQVLPEQGLAVVLLTNGGSAADLYQDLYREIFAELAGVSMPDPMAPPSRPASVDLGAHVGRYERAGVSYEVLDRAEGGVLRMTLTGAFATLTDASTRELDLVPGDESGDLFLVRQRQSHTWLPLTFYALPTGERYLHYGARATAKVT